MDCRLEKKRRDVSRLFFCRSIEVSFFWGGAADAGCREKSQIFDVLCFIGVVKRGKWQFFELLFAI